MIFTNLARRFHFNLFPPPKVPGGLRAPGPGRWFRMAVYRQLVIKEELLPEEAKKYQAQVLRGHSVITEPDDDVAKELMQKYKYYWRLAAWEEGGGYTNTGSAQIVCGVNGERLKPVLVRRRGHLANAEHALFIGQRLVTVYANHHRKDFMFQITEHSIDPKTGEVKEKEIWTYSDDFADAPIDSFDEWFEQNAPSYVEKFRDALKAAFEKAQCYHCRGVHYALL